jgi:hypothetical protein
VKAREFAPRDKGLGRAGCVESQPLFHEPERRSVDGRRHIGAPGAELQMVLRRDRWVVYSRNPLDRLVSLHMPS